MAEEQDLSGMNAEARLVTSQLQLKSVINSLFILQNYLDNNERNETSIKVASVLDLIIPQLETVHEENEQTIGMLR